MKVIFLDIDGVLNSVQQCIGWGQDAYNYVGINKTSLRLLKKLTEVTGAKIVVSSTWRGDGAKTFNGAFAALGWERAVMDNIVIDTTPHLSGVRGGEIQEWLAGHPSYDNYVIIDDDSDMLESQLDHFVKTDALLGFNIYDMVKAADILGVIEDKDELFDSLRKKVNWKLDKRAKGNHGYTL